MQTLTRALVALTRFALTTWALSWSLFVVTAALGGQVRGWQPVAAMLGGLFLAVGPARTPRARIGIGAMCCACTLASIAAAVHLPDCSWDANLYHYPAAFALADGWNPILASSPPIATASAALQEAVRCYPKAAWVLTAQLHTLLGNVDAGNMLHWLLLASVPGPALLLARYTLRSSRTRSLLFALLAAANPISLSQLATGYLDVDVAALSTIALSGWLVAAAGSHRSRFLTMPCLASVLLIGCKFTGLVYALCFGCAAIAIAAFRSRLEARRIAVAFCLACTAAVLLAFDSYVANLTETGNPFHPAWSANAGDILAGQADRSFLERPRPVQLALSIASSQCNDALPAAAAKPSARLPFTGISWRHQYDARFSGFGPWFFEAVLLSVLVWVRCRRPLPWICVVLAVGSTLLTTAGWWARLAPQLWLLPVVAVLVRERRWGPVPLASSIAFVALTVALSVNCLLVGVKSLRSALHDASHWNAAAAGSPEGTLARLLARPELEAALLRRLRERRRQQ